MKVLNIPVNLASQLIMLRSHQVRSKHFTRRDYIQSQCKEANSANDTTWICKLFQLEREIPVTLSRESLSALRFSSWRPDVLTLLNQKWRTNLLWPFAGTQSYDSRHPSIQAPFRKQAIKKLFACRLGNRPDKAWIQTFYKSALLCSYFGIILIRLLQWIHSTICLVWFHTTVATCGLLDTVRAMALYVNTTRHRVMLWTQTWQRLVFGHIWGFHNMYKAATVVISSMVDGGKKSRCWYLWRQAPSPLQRV